MIYQVFIGVENEQTVSTLNKVTYAYIAPVIITIGVVGDILTVATLTHPLLRRCSIIYTYLTLLAMTDLLTHFSIIPMILWLLDWRLCSPTSAFYYAHIGFPLSNALMGASVWIVVFLTLSQYMAVCQPFYQGYLRKRRICFLLFVLSYLFSFCIYAPWSTKKIVHVPRGLLKCSYVVCDRQILEDWFWIYEWVREFLTRIFPFLLIAYFNVMILITYKNTKRNRMRRLTNQTRHKQNVSERSEQEEKRLFVLLFAIIIVFFLCTIPAAPVTIFVADRRSQNLTFQIFRAVTNLLEFTKFALNFYFYCLINPDIRKICLRIIRCRKLGRPARVKGQPVNPISIYTRSTKSTIRNNGAGLCTGIPGIQNGSSRRDSIRSNTRILQNANTTTNNVLSRHRSMILGQGNSAYSMSSDKKLSNLSETSLLTNTPQKKDSALFLNMTPLNDLIVLFDANNKTRSNSSSFLSPKMTDFYSIPNKTSKIDESKLIDKNDDNNNDISTQMLTNKINLDSSVDETYKTSNIINQISDVQLEIKIPNNNLKTDCPNFSKLDNSDVTNEITKNYNDFNLINNNLKILSVDKPISDITSSDIVIANTFALLEILKSAEHKTVDSADDDNLTMLPLIENTEIKTLSKIAQKVVKRNLTHSKQSSNTSSLTGSLNLLQQEKNFEKLCQVVLNAQKRSNAFVDGKYSNNSTLKFKISQENYLSDSQLKQNPLPNSVTKIQNLISIAANASKAQTYLGKNLNTKEKNNNEIEATSSLLSPTISLTQLSLKNIKPSTSKHYTQKKQINDKKKSYHLLSDNVRTLAKISENALKSLNKNNCLLDESNYFLDTSLSNEDVKTLAAVTVKAIHLPDLSRNKKSLFIKGKKDNSNSINLKKGLDQRCASFSKIEQKQVNQKKILEFASNYFQRRSTYNTADLSEKLKLTAIINAQNLVQNKVPILTNIASNINQSTRVSVPVLSKIASNISLTNERNRSNTICGIGSKTACIISINNNSYSSQTELYLKKNNLLETDNIKEIDTNENYDKTQSSTTKKTTAQ